MRGDIKEDLWFNNNYEDQKAIPGLVAYDVAVYRYIKLTDKKGSIRSFLSGHIYVHMYECCK